MLGQWTLLPGCLDDFIDEDNPVRVIDVFVDALDLAEMSFAGVPGPSGPHLSKFRKRLRGKADLEGQDLAIHPVVTSPSACEPNQRLQPQRSALIV
jgi:hypothetical protein